ncbi:MAG: TVP38/TMEM64 family protein [Longimicrobiales bacterium]
MEVQSAAEPVREAGAGGPRQRGSGWRFLALVVLLVAALLALRLTPLGEYATREGALRLLEQIRGARGAPLIFIGMYTMAAALALPGSVLTLAGGAVFGLWPGVAYNLIGATLGATLAFLLARWLGRGFVAERLGGRVAELDRAVGQRGFRTIFVLRLIPLVPFNALNYGAGLSAVRPSAYVLATALGIVPGTAVYTYFADAVLAGSLEAERDALVHILIASALLILLAVLPLAWRRWQERA